MVAFLVEETFLFARPVPFLELMKPSII